MVVKIHHHYLSSWLVEALPVAWNEISNGFLLLQHLDLLEESYHTSFIEAGKCRLTGYGFLIEHEAKRLEAGLTLLIEGLLNDPQVFTSFGYQRLYDEGYLSYGRWKKFHSSWTNENIDRLEASYDKYNDGLENSHPSSHNAEKTSQDAMVQQLTCFPNLRAAPRGHEEDVRIDHATSLQNLRTRRRFLTEVVPYVHYWHMSSPILVHQLESCKPMRKDFFLREPEEYSVEMLRWLDPQQAFRNWCQSQKRLRRFHVAFQKEHRRFTRCPDLSDEWYCLHRDLAYQTGIGVLRGLCNGQTPSTVSETICFLAIAKAMSVATDDVFNSACNDSEFSRDLGRWQLLFKMEDGTLSTFRKAIACIWNVNLEDTPVQSPDPSTLKEFCDLACSIVQKADYSFEFSSYGSHRLLASQEDWRSRISPIPDAEANSPYIDNQIPKASYENPHPISPGAHCFPWYQNRDPLPTRVPSIPIREAISNDRCVCSINALVKLLMAGAIFSIIVVFLLGTCFFRQKHS